MTIEDIDPDNDPHVHRPYTMGQAVAEKEGDVTACPFEAESLARAQWLAGFEGRPEPTNA